MADFHPDLVRAALLLPRPMISPYTLPILRGVGRLFDRSSPADVERLILASGARVRLHRPPGGATGPGPGLLWIHGGGYLIGSAAQDDALCRRFARELGATVAAVDYRLAPEHPHPTSLEDCYAALQWLAGLPAVDSTRVAIGGASAGGGLTAALALMTRDRGEVDLAAQLLVYPMLDDRSSTESARDDPAHRLWSHRANRYGWSSYLGDADPAVAVPARRDDLGLLPPTWIGVGTNDLFHDEDLAYAERLKATGVPCEVEVVPGAFHGFDQVVAKAPVSQAFFASQVRWLNDALRPTRAADA